METFGVSLLSILLIQLVAVMDLGEAAKLNKSTKELTSSLGKVFPPPKLRVAEGPLRLPDSKDLLGTLDLQKLQENSLSRREARLIIGALDKQSCFAKVLCGLGTREPSKETGLLNDYAFLIGDLMVNSEENDNRPVLDDDKTSSEEEESFLLKDFLTSTKKGHRGRIGGKLFPPQINPRPLVKPKLYIRMARANLQKVRGGRQCRQMDSSKGSRCPFNEGQMDGIVQRLKQVVTDTNENTMLDNVVKTGQKVYDMMAMRKPNGENVNVVINLQHPAAIPPPSRKTQGKENATEIEPANGKDPLENLMTFLFNVGYAKNETGNSNSTNVVISKQEVNKEEDGSEEDDASREKNERRRGNRPKTPQENDEPYVKIKSSKRTGRFHRIGENLDEFPVPPSIDFDTSVIYPRPVPMPMMPKIIFKALRFLSVMMRGGPMPMH